MRFALAVGYDDQGPRELPGSEGVTASPSVTRAVSRAAQSAVVIGSPVLAVRSVAHEQLVVVTATPRDVRAIAHQQSEMATGSPAKFTPALIAGIAEYVDGDALALSNGANVTTWGSILGAFTATANWPTFETAGYNGKPSVKFDGVSQTLIGTSAVAIANGNSAAFWLVLAFQEIVEGVGAFFSAGRTTTTSSIYRIGRTGAVVYGSVATNDAGTTNTGFGSATPDTNRHVLSVTCTGGGVATVSQWLDGALDVNAASFVLGQTTLNESALGCAFTNGSKSLFANIRIRRGAFGTGALSTGDRKQLEAWCNG